MHKWIERCVQTRQNQMSQMEHQQTRFVGKLYENKMFYDSLVCQCLWHTNKERFRNEQVMRCILRCYSTLPWGIFQMKNIVFFSQGNPQIRVRISMQTKSFASFSNWILFRCRFVSFKTFCWICWVDSLKCMFDKCQPARLHICVNCSTVVAHQPSLPL